MWLSHNLHIDIKLTADTTSQQLAAVPGCIQYKKCKYKTQLSGYRFTKNERPSLKDEFLRSAFWRKKEKNAVWTEIIFISENITVLLGKWLD